LVGGPPDFGRRAARFGAPAHHLRPIRPLTGHRFLQAPMWLLTSAAAFHPPAANLAYRPRHASGLTPRMEAPGGDISRRQTAALALAALASSPAIARADSYAYQPALAGKDYGKSEMGGGADFTKTPSGLSYKDGNVGKGKTPAPGDRVVIDWTGYTVRGTARTSVVGSLCRSTARPAASAARLQNLSSSPARVRSRLRRGPWLCVVADWLLWSAV
jgi:hypothetical protein